MTSIMGEHAFSSSPSSTVLNPATCAAARPSAPASRLARSGVFSRASLQSFISRSANPCCDLHRWNCPGLNGGAKLTTRQALGSFAKRGYPSNTKFAGKSQRHCDRGPGGKPSGYSIRKLELRVKLAHQVRSSCLAVHPIPLPTDESPTPNQKSSMLSCPNA